MKRIKIPKSIIFFEDENKNKLKKKFEKKVPFFKVTKK